MKLQVMDPVNNHGWAVQMSPNDSSLSVQTNSSLEGQDKDLQWRTARFELAGESCSEVRCSTFENLLSGTQDYNQVLSFLH